MQALYTTPVGKRAKSYNICMDESQRFKGGEYSISRTKKEKLINARQAPKQTKKRRADGGGESSYKSPAVTPCPTQLYMQKLQSAQSLKLLYSQHESHR